MFKILIVPIITFGAQFLTITSVLNKWDTRWFFIVSVVSGVFFIKSIVKKRWYFCRSLILISLVVFVTFFQISTAYKNVHLDPLKNFVNTRVATKGTIVADPDIRIDRQFIILKLNTIKIQKQDIPAIVVAKEVLLRLSIQKEYVLKHGDTLTATGTLRTPEGFISDTGRLFAYDQYLAVRGITYTLSSALVTSQTKGSRSVLKSLFQAKQSLINQTNTYIHEPYAGLIAGVLYGNKGALNAKLSKQFRDAGIIHIVVLSGSNIIIVAQFLFALCSFIPIRKRLSVVLGGIWIFAITTGAEPPIIRAAIMGSIALVATHTGRAAGGLRALLLTIIVLSIFNPLLLLWDIGFQLSCAATAGLMVFTKPLAKIFTWIPNKFAFRETFTTTIATQIAVTPLLIFFIGEISIVSPITNVIILPAVPAAMLGGFITQLLGFVSPSLASVAGFISTIPVWFLVKVAEISSELTFATWFIPF